MRINTQQDNIEEILGRISQRLERIEARREPKLKMSDFFTGLTVAVSVCVAVNSWQKDRDLVRRAQAQQIRANAGAAMGKLDKCQSLSLSLLQDAPVVFEKAKKSLFALQQKNQLTNSAKEAVRTQTFSDLLEMHINSLHAINNLQMNVGYIDIKGKKNVRSDYREAVQSMRRIESDAYADIQEFTQKEIMSPSVSQSNFESTVFWNALADKMSACRKETAEKMKESVYTVNADLEQIINEPDGNLVETEDKA